MSSGTIAGANSFNLPVSRAQVFSWAVGNAAKKLAETDPAFRSGSNVVLFFSLEPDELPAQVTS